MRVPALADAYRDDTFLRRVIAIATQEAAELGEVAVDEQHLLLAATRPDLDGPATFAAVGIDVRKARDFVMFLSGVNEALGAQHDHRPYRRTAKRSPTPDPTEISTAALRRLDEVAREARRAEQAPGPPHLLVVAGRGVLVSFGVYANDVRRVFGLPELPAPVLAIPWLPRPQGVGRLVLGGGGEDVAHLIVSRLGLDRPPLVAYVGAGNPHSEGPGPLGVGWERAGAKLTDAGLYARDTAFDAGVCEAIRSADLVLLGSGQIGAIASALAGSPALQELISASDRGAVVVGSSSSAMEIGAVAVDFYGDGGPTPVQTLGWLASTVVSTHHRGTNDELENLRTWVWPAAKDRPLLLVPHMGAVIVNPGWNTFEVIDQGEHNIGAWWWNAPDGQPEPLSGTDPSR
jgi:hypothetical protein